MHMVVLSQGEELYSTRRLVDSATARGHEVSVLDYMNCRLDFGAAGARVIVNDAPLVGVDTVIPRVGASRTPYGAAVVQQFEAGSVAVLNRAEAIRRSRDKFRALQALSSAGLAIPHTAFAIDGHSAQSLIAAVGGAPLVIKLNEGSRGAGVVLAETDESAESTITALHMLEGQVMVQRFVAEAQGRDVRAFVVGETVVAAMTRIARPGEFRANLYRGGTAEPAVLSEDETRQSIRAARAMGLSVAGVDFLRSEDGPLFLEVNSSPGLAGIEGCTGIDVAEAIVKLTASIAEAQRL